MRIIITGDSQGFEHEELEKIYEEIWKTKTIKITINEIKYQGLVSQILVDYKEKGFTITKLRIETIGNSEVKR
jgi:hypothetical protein